MDKYFLGDIEEEFRKLAPNEPMPDDPVKRLVRINEIKSENKEKENLKKIEKEKREKEKREKEIELQKTKDLLSVTRIEISPIDEKIVLTKKERQTRKKEKIRIRKLNQTQIKKEYLHKLASRDKIKLTQGEEEEILRNIIKTKFSARIFKALTSNYNLIINKRKKEELKKEGFNFLDSEFHELWKFRNRLKDVKNKKPIHNLKDAQLEWLNIKLSTKNISRKESLDEAKQALECMEKKKELAKIMSKTYEEIDKKFNCDEIVSKIKMEIMNNLKVDSKMIERITEEEKIERKRERASRNLTENNG